MKSVIPNGMRSRGLTKTYRSRILKTLWSFLRHSTMVKTNERKVINFAAGPAKLPQEVGDIYLFASG